ncbi:MAG: hypothetical protein KY455_08070 [Euryarchaeota archaeon]|nr:hypothetical protein [Euryarchaeota archaeon]
MAPVVARRRRRFAILSLLALIAVGALSPTSAYHDGFPSGWETAIDHALGQSVSFEVTEGTPSAWYRFSPFGVDQAGLFRVTADGDGVLRGYVVDDDGRLLDIRYIWPRYDLGGAEWPVSALGSPGLRIAFVIDDAASSNVTVRADAIDLPDLELVDLRVDNVPITTDAGDLPAGVHRKVTVTITNNGPGHAEYVDASVWVDPRTDGDSRWLQPAAGSETGLAPGESKEITFWWDTTGQFGDVEVRADTYAYPGDSDHSNNFRMTPHYVLVGGTGVGIGIAPRV